MKICVIHGSQRKGNTERTIEIIKARVNVLEENKFIDVYLPKDLPQFCCGCFRCLDEGHFGGEYCPHAKYTHPILEAMRLADGLIVASPVYCLAESGQIKVFLDHFGCIYMSHRPLPEMFPKAALILSTTAGAGTKHVIKPIERNLKFWGIPKVYCCGLKLWAKNWEEMPLEKQNRYQKRLEEEAQAFYNAMKRQKRPVPIQTKFMFHAFKRLINSYSDGHPDKKYWREKGWLDKGRPW